MRSRKPRVVPLRSTFGRTYSVRESGEWWMTKGTPPRRRAWSTWSAADRAVRDELARRGICADCEDKAPALHVAFADGDERHVCESCLRKGYDGDGIKLEAEPAADPPPQPIEPKPTPKPQNAQTGDLRGGRPAIARVGPSRRAPKAPDPSSDDSLKGRVRAFLRSRPDATNKDVAQEFDELRGPMDVIRLLHGPVDAATVGRLGSRREWKR